MILLGLFLIACGWEVYLCLYQEPFHDRQITISDIVGNTQFQDKLDCDMKWFLNDKANKSRSFNGHTVKNERRQVWPT